MPFTYWLNGRWFLQIVERDSCNLYPLYLLFLLWFCILNVGGGCNVFLTFYAISNISRKKNLGIQNNYFSFNVFFVFFLYAGNIVKCPFTYSYWLNGRWFLQIVDIGNVIMRLEYWKVPLHLLVKWEVVSPNRRYTCREFWHEVNWKVVSTDIVDRDSGNLYPIYI